MSFLEQENKLPANQFGFRKHKGTDLAIAKTYETIAMNQHERGLCNVVARDVEKAFDKVWLDGLRHKIGELDLPELLEKIIFSFTKDRKAKIRYKNNLGNTIYLRSGVPQGSIISPTLFITYTADTPPPGQHTMDILFADDVTQVIEYHHQSKRILAARTVREIKRINDFERKWKIKTSAGKFKMLSISSAKPEAVIINNNNVPFTDHVNMLGLKLTRTGINTHVADRIRKAKTELGRLNRFRSLTPKTKAHLYKAFILPIMEYPIIPLCGISKSNKIKIQRIQNKAVKFIISNL